MAISSHLCEFGLLTKEAVRLTSLGEREKAEELYTKFIEQEHEKAENILNLALAINNRGHLRYLKVDFSGAVKDYTKALELNPTLAVSYYNRGQIHYRLGRFKMAIDDLKKAVELDPDFEDARQNLRQAQEDFASKSRNSLESMK